MEKKYIKTKIYHNLLLILQVKLKFFIILIFLFLINFFIFNYKIIIF
jgi:hypothetical protein